MSFCSCCVLPGCTIFSDTFTRANSTNVGSDWTETNGDWEIDTNSLRTSDSDALILCNTEADVAGLPDGDGYYVSVNFSSMVADQDYKVYLNYTDANNHYYFLCRKTGTDNCVQIYEVNGGATTWL